MVTSAIVRALFALLYISTSLQGFSPRVSIITSVYNGNLHIEHFLEDIVKQTMFDQCELIMINANSPHNEEPIILDYMERYSNILYIRLSHDPGLYAVWNIGIKLARAPYVTNANLDDRLRYDCYEHHANYLDNHPGIDLVYSGVLTIAKPNQTFDAQKNRIKPLPYSISDFSAQRMFTYWIPFPNSHPMWRKSMHRRYGLFDETFKSSGDMEMWLRAAYAGKSKFGVIKGAYGLFYTKNGLSTRPGSVASTEDKRIKAMYKKLPKSIEKHIEFL